MSDTVPDPRTLTVVEHFEHTGESGHAAAAQALAVNPRITALVCTADVLALGAGLGELAGHRRAQAVLGHGCGRQSQVPVLASSGGEERTTSAVWHCFATTLHPWVRDLGLPVVGRGSERGCRAVQAVRSLAPTGGVR